MEIATLQDLQTVKAELIEEIRSLKISKPNPTTKWVKSKKARDILGCSPGTLQNLRLNGTLTHSKLGGTLYYDMKSINQQLENNKQNAN